ncbi:hypothetical protein LguiB_002806 [Lonicera macranthoides]
MVVRWSAAAAVEKQFPLCSIGYVDSVFSKATKAVAQISDRIYESSRWKNPSRRHSSNPTHQRNSPSWCGMRVIFREASTIVSIRVPEKSPGDVVGVEEGEVDAGDIMKLC